MLELNKDKINILGTEYKVILNVDPINNDLDDGFGATFIHRKQIKIIDLYKHKEWENEESDVIDSKLKELLRHEVIHAFIQESGLSVNSIVFDDAWVLNEEMVDWFAIQSLKIFKIYEELNIL